MKDSFLAFVREHQLFGADSRVLAAVSGGMDSVVMADLLREAEIDFGVAHVNFGLRGEASDADEVFVRKLAKRYKAPCYVHHADAAAAATEAGVSVQMAARRLRYDWFHALRRREGYDVIATAHHRNDSLETVLLNLTRGTGLPGLLGVAPRNGYVVRPILFLSKEGIHDLLAERQLAWREDESNASDKYRRNQMRHHVMPVLQDLNPNLERTFVETRARLLAASQLLDEQLTHYQDTLTQQREGGLWIDLVALQATPAPRYVLYELLRPYGFNWAQTEPMAAAFDAQPGRQFSSPTHRLLKDRTAFILSKKPLSAAEEAWQVDEDTKALTFSRGTLRCQWEEVGPISRNRRVAQLDAARLRFPLTLRRWQPGDRFCPLGMEGTQKVSDLLINEKVPLSEKENVFVLTSYGEVVWVVGRRLDNRYKVTPTTERVFRVQYEAQNQLA